MSTADELIMCLYQALSLICILCPLYLVLSRRMRSHREVLQMETRLLNPSRQVPHGDRFLCDSFCSLSCNEEHMSWIMCALISTTLLLITSSLTWMVTEKSWTAFWLTHLFSLQSIYNHLYLVSCCSIWVHFIFTWNTLLRSHSSTSQLSVWFLDDQKHHTFSFLTFFSPPGVWH